MKQVLIVKMTSNDVDLQDRWKLIMLSACRECRYEQFLEDTKKAIKAFENLKDSILDLCGYVSDFVEELEDSLFSELSTIYPRFVDKRKVNTKGYPRPISRCARSRCK